MPKTPAPKAQRTADGKERIYRHALIVRVTHWINVICIIALIMSGLQIFNAHPKLYWGSDGTWGDPAALSLGPWPGWATLPSYKSLAMGRVWHLFFAWLFVINGIVYLVHLFAADRLRRDMAPTRAQWRGFWPSLISHLKLHRVRGEEAKSYNVLQKIAYLSIIFVLLPLMLLTGLTMSPGMNAAAPWLLDLFGGRQSARTIHFIAASAIVGFIAIHVFEVFLQGPVNEIRSMITGWFVVEPEKKKEARDDAKA